VPAIEDPLLQWATGLTTKDRRIYAGWLVEAGKHDDLDTAMHAADFEFVTIKHGNGNLVTHWAVPTANLFVVAEGMQVIGAMRNTEERFGIAFGWRRTEDGRAQSVLRARVFLRELLEVGYCEPLLLTLKSTVTGDFLNALQWQYTVLDALMEFRQAAGKTGVLPFYACSIPIGAGEEVARGNGSATREISPPVALVPNPVTKQYVKEHWIKAAWVGVIEDILDDTIRWSITTSALIGNGEEPRPDYEGAEG
jgi:hypothetical protein